MYQIFVASGFDEQPLLGNEDAISTKAEKQLRALKKLCLKLVDQFVGDYVWHLEGFKLQVSTREHPCDRGYVPDDSKTLRCGHLWGQTWYGDNVEDEWFILWLLKEITRPVHRLELLGCELVARAWDDDGEFLLIEAADTLPHWIQPSNSANRVFLHDGNVRVLCCADIPTREDGAGQADSKIGSEAKGLELRKALKALVRGPLDSSSESTSRSVNAVVEERLIDYPQKAQEMQQHTTVVLLPKRAAVLLKKCPQAVAQAVVSFFYRDPLDLKVITKRENNVFTAQKHEANAEEEELLPVKVKMNRSHYAQLMQQHFTAPGGYHYPSLPFDKASPSFLASELGMKLTCGLEMFHTRMGRKLQLEEKIARGESVDTLDVEALASVEWKAFLSRLKALSYFEGEIEGSQRYKTLVEEAKRSFLSSKNHLGGSLSFGASEEDLLVWNETKKVLLLFEKQELCPSVAIESDLNSGDSDAWLYGGEERFREMTSYSSSAPHHQHGREAIRSG